MSLRLILKDGGQKIFDEQRGRFKDFKNILKDTKLKYEGVKFRKHG